MMLVKQQYDAGRETINNIITNNIFVNESGDKDAAHFGDADDTVENNIVDYNCYWATYGDGIVSCKGEDMPTINDLRDWWAGNGASDRSKLNDVHSLFADPKLKADGTLRPDSPCIIAGEPAVLGETTAIGAGQNLSRALNGVFIGVVR